MGIIVHSVPLRESTFLKGLTFMYMCIHIYMCADSWACVCVCLSVQPSIHLSVSLSVCLYLCEDSRLTPGIFLDHTLCLSYWSMVSLRAEISGSRVWLPSLLQRNSVSNSRVLRTTGRPLCLMASTRTLRTWTLVFILTQQELYPLVHLPSPRTSIYVSLITD